MHMLVLTALFNALVGLPDASDCKLIVFGRCSQSFAAYQVVGWYALNF